MRRDRHTHGVNTQPCTLWQLYRFQELHIKSFLLSVPGITKNIELKLIKIAWTCDTLIASRMCIQWNQKMRTFVHITRNVLPC
jgi:hypothetical protein